MLHREDAHGLIVITQPIHSWVSGQLARHWGNDTFGTFAPVEDVCLAAEQHDIGFLEWERSPTLNPQTGRPHDFLNMPKQLHREIWSHTVEQMLGYSRYAAYLVSLHVTSLSQRQQGGGSRAGAERSQEFLEVQDAIQHQLLSSLRSDPCYADHCAGEVIERNRKLILTWDLMSLLVCLASPGRHVLPQVPSAHEDQTLTLELGTEHPTQAVVKPWPFRGESAILVLEGHRLPQTFTDQNEMRSALRTALPVSLQVCLTPNS